MGKQSAHPRSEVRGSSYSRARPESPARANYTARGAERGERVHVEERRPYDVETEYFDRPRSSARKDYDYEQRPIPKRAVSKNEKERSRTSKQSTKENERARQREKTRQSTRDTRRDRDYKYASYPEPETTSSSESDTIVEPQRYSRREEEDRRRERDSYYEQPRRREDSARAFHMEDRSHKTQTHESFARDYIERSRGGARQYQEPVRRPSPQRVSTKDKVEYIKRSEGRPAVMVRRGSGKPRPASREPEEELPRRESPIRESPRRERERTRRSSNDYGDMPRQAPPLNHTKSAPEQIHVPGEPMPYPRPVSDPRRAYSMQEPKDEEEIRPPPMRRAETMPTQINQRRERESTRKPPKASGLRRTENLDSLPTPGATPEPTIPQKYARAYADDHEVATPDGYRTEVHEPSPAPGSRKVTRSPSPLKAERVKEDRGRASSSRYPATSPRPPLQPSRTTSYVYGAQGLQDVSATRPSLNRNESVRSAAPQLFGEIPTTASRSSPRQTRNKYSPPGDDSRHQRFMPEERPRTGYNSSRRNSEAVRPTYARNPSYTSQAAY